MHQSQSISEILSHRFKIKRLLGQGSFGNVYQCEERKNNQLFAVKVISKINVRKSKIQCLREEAKLMLTLDHPNIVKVYQFFEDQQILFIKMEYVKNGTLGQFMKQKQLSKTYFTDEQTAQIMNSIFQAVYYIHSRSILHRDIKPQNILITDKKDLAMLKIADFGLGAKLQFRSPTAISKCGTYLFMAPEIMWNYTYTKAVDIWSCAIIMYMLKKGNHPFYEPKMTNDQFKEKIKNIIFPPLDDENPENSNHYGKQSSQQNAQIKKKKSILAQDLMNRISKLTPNQRYTAQDAIKHPWITRNFDDQIPLSLHDSFSGFEISHQISLMMKMFIMLKGTCYRNSVSMDKSFKSQIFQKYAKYCEQVNKKDRSISPLKVRRLNNLNSTRQIRELCELSELSISPKKIKQNKRKITQLNDSENPTIMKLNLIFSSLFDKKQKKNSNYSEQFLNNLTAGNLINQFHEQLTIPNISLYKNNIQSQIEKAVHQRTRRKKQRILPLRKTNEYGEVIGKSCESKSNVQLKPFQNKNNWQPEYKSINNSMNEQIELHSQMNLSSSKTRVRRRISATNYGNKNKYIT